MGRESCVCVYDMYTLPSAVPFVRPRIFLLGALAYTRTRALATGTVIGNCLELPEQRRGTHQSRARARARDNETTTLRLSACAALRKISHAHLV